MPQKRKKHNFNGANQQNEAGKSVKPKQSERQWVKKSDNVTFTNDELHEIKTILKRKHLSKTPMLISATVLSKSYLIETLLKKGNDVNEQDETGATALTWAVKTKNMETIKILLKAENILLKTDTYDHIIFVALGASNWDESSFYNLWNNVKVLYPVGVNILNKEGRSMLHCAVEREWMSFIDVLITENADVNIQDLSGATPIMLACSKNHLKIMEYFLEHNVDLAAEDCNGLTALCYIISTSVRTGSTYLLVDKLLDTKAQISLIDYVKSRVELISGTTAINYATEPSNMLINVLRFIINNREDGLDCLTDLNVFETLKEGLLANAENGSKLKIILSGVNELVKYDGEVHTTQKYDLKKLFVLQGCADVSLTILQKYKNIETDMIGKMVLNIIINSTCDNNNGKLWLEANHDSFTQIIKNYSDEELSRLLNVNKDFVNSVSRMKHFLGNMSILRNGGKLCSETNLNPIKSTETLEMDKTNGNLRTDTRSSKKTKRRSKALKAKIQKIKNADLAERLNLNKIPETKSETATANNSISEDNLPGSFEPEACQYESEQCKILFEHTKFKPDDCTIVNAIKSTLLKEESDNAHSKSGNSGRNKRCSNVEWKNKILSLPFTNSCMPSLDSLMDMTNSNSYSGPKLYSHLFTKKCDVRSKLEPIMKYLTDLLNKIIQKYQKHWEIDNELENEIFRNEKDGPSMNTLFSRLENDKIDVLLNAFYQVIEYIREYSQKDIGETIILMNNLERLLLNHEIRGKTIMAEVAAMETITVNVQLLNNFHLNSNYSIENYMEDVLNNKAEPSEHISIKLIDTEEKKQEESYKSDIQYLQELSKLPPKKAVNSQKVHEDSMETMKHAYHLVDSIMAICESDDDEFKTERENPQGNKTSVASSETAENAHAESSSSKGGSRWCSLVRSLELMKDGQSLLNSEVRISCQRKRTSHVISTGGNFTPVELGLDAHSRPLAVKRIPRGSNVCTMINNILTPLLDLRNPNILHYFVCDYDHNELILATPLCEYNIGQYLMLMKQNKITLLSALDIVRQFLNGLLFLHTQTEAIVHGNLKPSNIFVDLNSNVRLAEFGIHEALFTLKEAPNSSVIWFSTESYKNFKQTSVMQCTLASDIQVSGMLIHFILTGGTHAYGGDTKDILKNLEKGIPQLISSDLELQDLLTWMLLYFPNERPSVQQVLSHVFFWTIEKRWQFILICSGITMTGTDLPINLENLYFSMDKISFKESIKGNWVQVVKRLIPNLSKSDDDDSPTGLLKFIRSCFKDRPPIDFNNDSDRCNYFINSFPTFPLSLYRMLENTEWLDHPVFIPFYTCSR